MSYAITLKHVRYGKVEFDLADLRRRIETLIAGGGNQSRLGRLLARAIRLMAMIDALDAGRVPKSTLDAELALLMLDFGQVQAILSGTAAAPRRRARALPAPRRRLPRQT